MNFDLQQAVTLLKDLLWLKSASLETANRTRADGVIDEVLDAAFEEVERLTVDWVTEKEAHAARLIAAEEQARRDVIEEEQRAAKALIQDVVDQAQRQKRSIAGVS